MITRYLQTFTAILVIALIISVSSHAQTTTGTFLGYVTDTAGEVLKGAKVTAINESTGLTRTVPTSATGEYVIALLPVGKYTLTFEAGDFKQRSLKGVTLEIDQRARIDAVLEVGPV
ncbi:MAG: carboxypeptidase regulatory-like domain-containing protein, partial [Blastocatellia bacterium]|nr:carboxypeptidase regulatory-like domain-containing protein [Blastocatellia bacterium]